MSPPPRDAIPLHPVDWTAREDLAVLKQRFNDYDRRHAESRVALESIEAKVDDLTNDVRTLTVKGSAVRSGGHLARDVFLVMCGIASAVGALWTAVAHHG